MMDLLKENFVWIVVSSCLLLALLHHKWQGYKRSRLRKKRFARGEKMEAKAAVFLKNKGFEIIATQEVFYHSYVAGGIEKKARLEVDYLVSKRNKTFVVEVKSGEAATQIENKSTRRQILEYSVAIPCDGIFLLDMEKEQLHKIEFKKIEGSKDSFLYYRVLLLLMVCGAAASPNWDAKSVFIGLAIVLVSFPRTVGKLLALIK